MLRIAFMSTSCEIGLRWVPHNTLDDKSALGHVMAWCCQAPSHYLSQSWPRSVSPYGLSKPQWVKKNIYAEKVNDIHVFFAGLLYQWNQEPHTMCIFKWHWTLVSVLYPCSTKLKGVYWIHLVRPSVRLSVCGQNCVHSVSSTILARSMPYLHILSSKFRRCVTCKVLFQMKKNEVWGNSLNL